MSGDDHDTMRMAYEGTDELCEYVHLADGSFIVLRPSWPSMLLTHPVERYDREAQAKIYLTAKAGKVGDIVNCAGCGKQFHKRSYQQAFCSNKGTNNCKDRYWNRASDSRVNRAKWYLGLDK